MLIQSLFSFHSIHQTFFSFSSLSCSTSFLVSKFIVNSWILNNNNNNYKKRFVSSSHCNPPFFSSLLVSNRSPIALNNHHHHYSLFSQFSSNLFALQCSHYTSKILFSSKVIFIFF